MRQKFKVSGYSEKHHIIPSSLGGTNDSSNIVSLSPKEHFVCHHLLTRMVAGNDWYKMINAFHCMTRKSDKHKRDFVITSKVYQILRESMSKTMAKNRLGKKHSEETKKLMSKIKSEMTPETKLKMSLSQTGKIMPELTKQKISDSSKGRKFEESHKAQIADSLKMYHANKQIIYTCIHCGSETKLKTNFLRWHDSKCRKKSTEGALGI
jgi:hypothetical protein